ncbi:MAG TPA: histidine--tRNA ligase [Clostridiales bacterium]|jgi:histidyl-tRNA synthetase|nr:histidine--tRNA ligase [Clostridiales bacterium]
MKNNLNPAKGMRDFLPVEQEVRDYVERTIIDVYKTSGFELIETPVVENIDNLMGSQGGDNLKLIYKILKRGNKLDLNKKDLKEDDIVELGLRYDLTIPLSRFYCNNRHNLPAVVKAIQVGNVFRAERAQKGRYRSFKQCDIDIIGDGSSNAEIELLAASARALNALNVENFQIKINDRRILKSVILHSGFDDASFDSVCVILDKLDKIGYSGIEKELIAKGYDKDSISSIINVTNHLNTGNLFVLADYGVPVDVLENMNYIINNVKKIAKGKYEIVYDFSLVRGMGYYTGPIFEIVYKDLGYSIAGGGRYDTMIGEFIGQDIPAVGFSIGFERLVNKLIDDKFTVPGLNKLALFYKASDDFTEVMNFSDILRSEGYAVTINMIPKKLNKTLEQLSKNGFSKFCIYNIENCEIKELN